MIIEITSNNKILKDSPRLEFPSFVVLTGENGSGKTQFLEEVNESLLPKGVMIPPTDKIRLSNVLNSNGIRYRQAILINSKFEIKRFPEIVADYSHIRDEGYQSMHTLNQINELWSKISYVARSLQLNFKINESNYHIQSIIDEHNEILKDFFQSSRVFHSQNANEPINPITKEDLELTFNISRQSQKEVRKLEKHDLLIFYPIKSELFSSRLEVFLHQYEYKIKYYPKLNRNEKTPLEVFNELLNSAKFNYEATYISSGNINKLGSLKLKDKISGVTVNIDKLSSGEKSILSLVFIIFSTNQSGLEPDLLLLDEPDAYLHPTMTESLINAINDVLVKEKKIDVILTTHSPTTVALSPDDSIFKMSRTKGYPEKIDKNDAINSLTHGIHGLFVSNEKRRQVFVESDYDVEYYEGIYKLLKKRLNEEIQLNFISSGKTKVDGNGDEIATCDRVINITKQMRSYNNKQIFGIIDRDRNNKTTDGIAILGNGKRYSIENYLLDPVLIGLILERESHFTFEEMGITDKNYLQLLNFTEVDFQKISDFVISQISDLSQNVIDCNCTDTENYELINGIRLKIPKWFINHQGHLLEKGLIDKIKKLGDIKRSKEKGLKLAIINKLLKDNPDIMPKDFLTVFEYLHSN